MPPGDPAALSEALRRLLRDPTLRRDLGAAGEARVRRDFDAAVLLDALAGRFGLADARAAE